MTNTTIDTIFRTGNKAVIEDSTSFEVQTPNGQVIANVTFHPESETLNIVPANEDIRDRFTAKELPNTFDVLFSYCLYLQQVESALGY